MTVTDPTAIKYCNERARKYADLKAQLCYFAQVCLGEWSAKDMNDLIPVDGGLIEDGSGTTGDKRTPIEANDVRTLRQRMIEDLAVLENQAQLNNLLKVAVNPTRS